MPNNERDALTRAEIDTIVYECRQRGDDSTYSIVNAALAATAPNAGAPLPAASPGLVQEVDYAIHHGWPKESLDKLERILEADKARAKLTPAGAPLPLAPSETQLQQKFNEGREFEASRLAARAATPQQALPLAPGEARNALEPVVSLGFDKAEDGTYTARLTVSGLPSEQQAQAAVGHMQHLFCGQEQAARQ